jgi:hypothetical protein
MLEYGDCQRRLNPDAEYGGNIRFRVLKLEKRTNESCADIYDNASFNCVNCQFDRRPPTKPPSARDLSPHIGRATQ